MGCSSFLLTALHLATLSLETEDLGHKQTRCLHKAIQGAKHARDLPAIHIYATYQNVAGPDRVCF